MRITALVENISCDTLIRSKHGLSLYIETANHKILFDLGPDKTLFENAKAKGIDLSKVDIVIISHGHMDHGGALEKFLEINQSAKIYVQRTAFEPHYTKALFLKVNVGIDKKLASSNQMMLIDGNYMIDDELSLFTALNRDKCYSPMNDALLDADGKDCFAHEQNLLISGSKTALIMGCGHTGIVNILESVRDKNIDLCVGGYHLSNPVSKKTVCDALLDEIAEYMSLWDKTSFYTCHCTGLKAYNYLSKKLPNLHYLNCGETIE